MGKETNTAAASVAVLAEPGAVQGWVKPTLKHPVCVLAKIAVWALTSPELNAGCAAVIEPSRVSSPCVLAGMHEWAFCPVVGVGSGARFDFEGEHSEFVRGVNAAFDVRNGGIDGVILLLFRGGGRGG